MRQKITLRANELVHAESRTILLLGTSMYIPYIHLKKKGKEVSELMSLAHEGVQPDDRINYEGAPATVLLHLG